MQTPIHLHEINLFHLEEENYLLPPPTRNQVKKYRSHKQLTPNQIIKNNMISIRQKRRIRELKTVTEQNLKMFYRIQSQKSQYQFQELHRQFSKRSISLQKGQQTHSQVSLFTRKAENTGLRARCKSAQRLLKANIGNVKSNEIESKLTYGDIMIEDEEEAKFDQKKQKNTVNEKSNKRVVSRAGKENNRIISTQKKDKIDQNIEKNILNKKLGVKIPIEKMKQFGLKQPRKNLISCAEFQINSMHPKIKGDLNDYAPLSERQQFQNI